MNGKKKFDFIRSMDNIYAELVDNYERFGTTRYFLVDDTVNDSPEKCKMLYDMAQRLPFKLEWWGYIRLDLLAAHPQTVDWLFGSGLRAAFFGIETLNSRTAKAIGKSGNTEKLIETLRKIKQAYGDEVNLHGSFIYGLPHESVESLNSTSEFLLSDQNPLDSWWAYPLVIKKRTETDLYGFTSDLDMNYEKFGYEDQGDNPNDDGAYVYNKKLLSALNWKNECTTIEEAENLVNDLLARAMKADCSTLLGLTSFDIAGLGQPLSYALNKRLSEIDWYHVDKMKIMRAREYKRRLYENLRISPIPETFNVKTYTMWLVANSKIKP